MEKAVKHTSKLDVRLMVFTALMAALSTVLSEYPKIATPIFFISFEFSDVPAMLALLTMGPVSGVLVCLVKNLWGCITSRSVGVGEISNFILSTALVLPAGIIAHKREKFSAAVIGVIVGVVAMTLVSIPSNLFIVYPFYAKVVMPMDAIIDVYKKVFPNVDSLIDCLLVFNVPFTFLKGAVAAAVSVVLYKRLRPIFNSIYREK